MNKHASIGYKHVLRLLIMKWWMNEHDILKVKTFQLGFQKYWIMHVWFERFKFISWPKCLHESCSILSLENLGSCFSFIGPIDHEIWPFSYNCAVMMRLFCTIFLSMMETSNGKMFNWKLVRNWINLLQI